MILITGANGQLGTDIAAECDKRGLEYLKTDSNELDITNQKGVNDFFSANVIDSVIHCAAYTAVDQAEDDEERCRRINVEGTRNIAEACKAHGCKLLYVSTDYVFDGTKSEPYEVDDQTCPTSVYGQTKYDGEVAAAIAPKHFIARISWVFGLNGKNFVKTMLRIGQDKDQVNVVMDQIGSPTYTKDASVIMVDMIESEMFGTYHLTNEGFCSWADFAKAIFEKAGYSTKVNAIPSDAYPTKAKRPQNSCLSKKSLLDGGFKLMPAWQDALDRYLKELADNGGLK